MLNIAPKLLLRSLLVLIALACLSYLADFAVLRWKFSHKGDAFGKVTIRRYFAVPRKDGKEEYMEDDPRVESCVHSLYPHSAVPPCWYLNKHREQRVNM
jgi:hypothetical protein